MDRSIALTTREIYTVLRAVKAALNAVRREYFGKDVNIAEVTAALEELDIITDNADELLVDGWDE